jgi:ferredoxin
MNEREGPQREWGATEPVRPAATPGGSVAERGLPHRLELNPIACDAHGLCADLLPEMITLDEWGYPILAGREVPEQLLPHARRAVAACPTLALALARRPAGPRTGRAAARPGPTYQGGRAP